MLTLQDVSGLLVCPLCARELVLASERLECVTGHSHPVVEGIAVLAATSADDEHKRRQAAYFDAEDEGFEITRPVGTPRFHGWLLEEKFRRGVAGVEGRLPGATVLTVCSGSGMDAAFLARAGARVIASDISFGAARRAQERARRERVALLPLVADVERLPFRSRSVDVVYVHDGLHHLEDPLVGVEEMARVARDAVCITEPVRAAATRLSVALGVSLDVEEAGNPVRRVDSASLCEELRREGFASVDSERYAMFYRHHPGPVARFLSRAAVFPLARRALAALNVVVAPVGNKLAVRAVRD